MNCSRLHSDRAGQKGDRREWTNTRDTLPAFHAQTGSLKFHGGQSNSITAWQHKTRPGFPPAKQAGTSVFAIPCQPLQQLSSGIEISLEMQSFSTRELSTKQGTIYSFLTSSPQSKQLQRQPHTLTPMLISSIINNKPTPPHQPQRRRRRAPGSTQAGGWVGSLRAHTHTHTQRNQAPSPRP